MEATQGDSGTGSSSGSRVGQLDKQMWECILSDITLSTLEQTHVIFGMIKECIMEVFEERLVSFFFEMVASVGAPTLTFR